MPVEDQEEPEHRRFPKSTVTLKFIELVLNIVISILVSLDCYSIRKSAIYGSWFFYVLILSIFLVFVQICGLLLLKLSNKSCDTLEYFGSMISWTLYTFAGICCLNISIRVSPLNTIFVFLTACIFIADIMFIADFTRLHVTRDIIGHLIRTPPSAAQRDDQIEDLIKEQDEHHDDQGPDEIE